jgi:hypothetical protein
MQYSKYYLFLNLSLARDRKNTMKTYLEHLCNVKFRGLCYNIYINHIKCNIELYLEGILCGTTTK